ncbi:MAG: DUF3616 domain-containing protein [Phycisphaerae bacterium]
MVLAAAALAVVAAGCAPDPPEVSASDESAATEDEDTLPLIEASGLVIRGGGKVAVVCGDEARDRLWGVSLDDPGERWILRFPRTTPSLDDLESLAPWGEHNLLAATSQTRTKTKEKTRPARNRLALVSLTPDARRVVGVRVYENLRGDLLRYLTVRCGNLFENVQAIVMRGPNDGGLNVEGMAVWRGRLMLGLRSPLSRGRPVVVPVANPEAVVEGGRPPEFDAPVVLPTEPDEAIRGLTEGSDETILVLLGPGTDAPGPSQRLVRWWPQENRLEEVKVPALEGIERAEGLAVDADGRLLLVTDYRLPLPRQVFHRLEMETP